MFRFAYLVMLALMICKATLMMELLRNVVVFKLDCSIWFMKVGHCATFVSSSAWSAVEGVLATSGLESCSSTYSKLRIPLGLPFFSNLQYVLLHIHIED